MVDILSGLIVAAILVFGLIIGSFLNCAVWRLYNEESVAKGRSYCPKCRHKLAWFDLIPILSFAALKGRCRYCKKPISWQYPLVEAVTAGLFVFTALAFTPEIFVGQADYFSLAALLCYWAVISSLVVIFVADLRWYFIPDEAVAAGIIGSAGLAAVKFFQKFVLFGNFDADIITNPLLAGVAGGAFFLAIFLVSRGKWMGFGDVKYAFLMGLILGFPGLLAGLFFAFFFGAIIGLIMVARQKKKLSSEIPFGPFLVVGTFVIMFFSDKILNWYLWLGA